MDSRLRTRVRGRAQHRCEYCLLPEAALLITFHIEHIRARQHGGATTHENLALACDRCNLHKGPNLSSVDPDTDEIVELFHPRTQIWSSHFRLQDDALIVGLTPTGRATLELLNMNADERLRLRRRLVANDLW